MHGSCHKASTPQKSLRDNPLRNFGERIPGPEAPALSVGPTRQGPGIASRTHRFAACACRCAVPGAPAGRSNKLSRRHS